MFGSLLLDDSGDLLQAFERDNTDVEYDTIAVALGAYQVAQSVSMRASTKKRSVWFNRAAGVDYNALFYDTSKADATMNPIRSIAFREQLLSTPGISRFADDADIRFTRTGRQLAIELPCVVIDCDNSRITPTVLD